MHKLLCGVVIDGNSVEREVMGLILQICKFFVFWVFS